MSVKVIDRALRAKGLSLGEKLVLVALANHANADGKSCFPEMQMLADDYRLPIRTVRRAVEALEKGGHLSRKRRGRRGYDYHIHPDGLEIARAAMVAPQTPLSEGPNPPFRAAMVAPPSGHGGPSIEPSVNRQEPSKKNRARAPKFILPSDIPAEAWAGFVEMRRSIRKPLTERSKKLAVTRLRQLAEDGWPPGVVLNHSTLNSYQGLFPPARGHHDRPANQPTGIGSTEAAAIAALKALEPR